MNKKSNTTVLFDSYEQVKKESWFLSSTQSRGAAASRTANVKHFKVKSRLKL